MGRDVGESDGRVVDVLYTASANTPRHLHLHRRSGLPAMLSLKVGAASRWCLRMLVTMVMGVMVTETIESTDSRRSSPSSPSSTSSSPMRWRCPPALLLVLTLLLIQVTFSILAS